MARTIEKQIKDTYFALRVGPPQLPLPFPSSCGWAARSQGLHFETP